MLKALTIATGLGASLAGLACGPAQEADPAVPEASADETSATADERPGVLLVANKSEGTVSFVDPDAAEVVATVGVGEGPHEVAASPDGRWALVTNYGTRDAPGSTLTLLDVPAREAARTIELGEHTRPHGVVWLPGGERALVTTEGSKRLVCVNPATGDITCEIPTEQEVSHMVAITPDGRRAFVANIGSGSITAIDVEAREKLGDIETGEGTEGVAVSPDGREVWVTNRAADTVVVLDAQSLEITTELSSSTFPIRAHITGDGAWVLVTNARSGTLAVIDRAGREVRDVVDMGVEAPAPDPERVLGEFEDTTLPIGVVADTAGGRAFVAHALADVVSILDLDTLETTGTIAVGSEPDGMAYVPGTP